MARFFIDRPVFAWVLALVIMGAGLLSIFSLPVQQYPTIAPPTVTISTSYPGASASTLENTVTQLIEQNMNGIDNLRYISSTSDSSGNVSITITFEPGTNADIAQVQVQNKLSQATPLLPSEVQQRGVKVTKSSGSFLMVAAFYSADNSMSQYEISDYVSANIQDPVSRVNGVGQLQAFGPQHSMRIWLDPSKMVNYRLTTLDVIAAIKAQNNQVAAGELGGAPSVEGQQLNATIVAQTRLETTEQFGNILLRVNEDGSRLSLKDVARIELGAENYSITARFMGKPAAGIGVNLATGANALVTADAVKARITELSAYFPAGLTVSYPYDSTPFVRISIHEVVKTLIEAVVLVFLVMFLFLQSWRATFIPTVAVPVVLMGTFGILAAFGFSINTLTLFGMVLAIGLLVDDAIVVVENVERLMEEEDLAPLEATRKSMDQITGALVGIALVLSAVFVPMAFFEGSTGAIYRQFSITVVSAMALSVFVALTLTPALCASVLKRGETPHAKKGFFGWFNRRFDASNARYKSGVSRIVRHKLPLLLIYLVLVATAAVVFVRVPTSFLPEEDQGRLFVLITTPPGATSERTLESVKQAEEYLMNAEKENVESFFAIVGFSFAGRGQNSAMVFVNLKDWDLRKRADQSVFAISQRAMGAFSQIRDARAFAIVPPAVSELGNSGGFDFHLVDQANQGHEKLMAARNQLLGMAAQDKRLMAVRPNGLEDTPQYRIDVDQTKAQALNLSLSDINDTLAAAWGSSYVNDFIDNGRVKKVYLQSDAPFRMLPEDVDRWYVRNSKGDMVPFSTFSTGHWEFGSPRLERFNGLSSRQIQGSAAPGVSSGEAMNAVEEIARKLPPGYSIEWAGVSYEEREAGAQAPMLYAISLIVVFLCLAALYESWTIPLSVILVVPLGILGAVLATWWAGQSNDVYFQVGLLLTIGLSAKNAILIVEFAQEQYRRGSSAVEAAVEAARLRLRPIIMTSLAFILGVLPLALANGAGSGSQNAIGVGVVGGMLSATVLIIFFAPLFFVAVRAIWPGKTLATSGERYE